MLLEMTPPKIKAQLDQYVIGQQEAKITLAVAVYNHLKRIYKQEFFALRGVQIAKSNVLLLGPSGCGKTELIRQLAKVTDLPYAIMDASNITEDGCKGASFSDFVKTLLIQNKCNLRRVEKAIVFIDEFDKKTKTVFGSAFDNKSGIADQQSLLKLIEGKEVEVKLDSDFIRSCNEDLDPYESIKVSTKDMLFVFGGAFIGIEKLIAARTKVEKTEEQPIFGLKAEVKQEEKNYNQLIDRVMPEDLLQYGIIPEILGRIPIIVPLHALELEDYISIIAQTKNSILAQYKAMYALNNISLEISEEAIREIASRAKTDCVGARALQGIVSKVILDNSYQAYATLNGKKGKIIIGKKCITAGEPAVVVAV